ncbi:meiosis protein SPO22/ZIP4 like-domain-containing protein [Apiosordaria backusii]|uniref:Meiosis protein SPO22/ZIP4 like-domain-containing protein n=1 Tax=Apiosordaria backusii TaxID=314023 RepID=A0AA40BE99_9PEZI|nr:meiosis protein SPO22/ZIP4 like-domain-containing protein [Apiosordaria backusii]
MPPLRSTLTSHNRRLPSKPLPPTKAVPGTGTGTRSRLSPPPFSSPPPRSLLPPRRQQPQVHTPMTEPTTSMTHSSKPDKRITPCLEFATKLLSVLSSPDDIPAIDSLLEEISSHIDKVHLLCQRPQPSTQLHQQQQLPEDTEIDSVGVKLWNLCTRLWRDYNDPIHPPESINPRLKKLSLYGKGFGFWLVVFARSSQKKRKRRSDLVDIIKLGLKITRDLVGQKETKLAGNALQLVADHKTHLQDLGQEGWTEEEINEANCLEVEYFIWRTALAWVEGRLDVAEHMYTKAERLRSFLTRDYTERLADVLYEIGKSLSGKQDYKIAVKWLERANEVVNGLGIDQLTREGVELRLAILQGLVSALLGTGTEEDHNKAKNYVDFLEVEMGNKMVVSLLKLEVLHKMPQAEVFDEEGYADVLRHLIRNFDGKKKGGAEFKLIVHHIRKLHEKSPGAGCAVLDDFILVLRTVGNGGQEFMEKALVTRMWMMTQQRDSTDTVRGLGELFGNITRAVSAEAAVAAQALSYTQGEYALAEAWCQLALAPIFEKCGPGNKAKLESMETATRVINDMSPSSWKEPMTAYLAFKVAIRTEDRELAVKCLETISQTPEHVDFLGACIAESQKAGDVTCAIAALKKLQDKYEYKEPNPIHLPALFRCTIRLLNMLVDRADADENGVVEDLCDMFGAVVIALEKQKKENSRRKLFTIDELEWFSRNSYNLALKNTTTWDLRYIVRMLTSCVKIIGYFPSDMGSSHVVEIALKMLFSRFIISSALVSLARAEDNVAKQLEEYTSMREHVLAFDTDLPELLPQLDEHSREDMLRKHATLLTFDFEAAVVLEAWDDLGGIVQRAVGCRSVTAFQAMADSLLRARAPGQVLYSTMRKLVNEIWVLEAFDAVKLAKYTRCLFQATLPVDDGLAMKLLEEACGKARELRESQAAWPEEELEWMAATAFNHAIDCYSAHEMERSREWAMKAIKLAGYCQDDGGLEGTLRAKYERLNLG